MMVGKANPILESACKQPMQYVLGFLFRNNGEEVALIRKTRPEWQKGMLNGIGGKVKIGLESPNNAIQREFLEEAGALIKDWRLFCLLNDHSGEVWKVFLYVAHAPEGTSIRTCEAEQVGWYPVKDLTSLNVIPNLHWIIPMALDSNHILATATENL